MLPSAPSDFWNQVIEKVAALIMERERPPAYRDERPAGLKAPVSLTGVKNNE